MTILTVPVTCIAHDQGGNPVSGALFTFELVRKGTNNRLSRVSEIYQGFVAPELIEVVANDEGLAVVNLFPNALGVKGSQYRVTATNPEDGEVFLAGLATIPNAPTSLHLVMEVEPLPPLNDVQVAAASALASANAANNSKNAAAQSEANANEDAQSTAEDRQVVEGITAQFGDVNAAIQGANAHRQAAAQSEENAAESEENAAASEAHALKLLPHYGTTPPVDPELRQEWIHPDGRRYTYVNPGSGPTWVESGSVVYIDDPESVAAAVAAKDLSVTARNESVAARDVAVGARDDSILARNVTTAARDTAVGAAAAAETSNQAATQTKNVSQSMIDAAFRAGTITPVDFTNAANYQRVCSTITNPDTRYDVALVGNDFQVDIRQAALMFAGARLQNVTQQGGRVYRVRGKFDAAGTAPGAAAALVLAFDPGVGTGANVLLDAAGAGWAWRKDGNVQPYNFSTLSGTAAPTYAFTLISGALTTWDVGDDIMVDLTANAANTAGTLRCWKNGVVVATGTVAAIPAGRLCALFMGSGGGGAYPTAIRCTFSTLAVSDPVPAPQVVNLNVATANVLSNLVTGPGLSRAQPLSPVRDASALSTRSIPAGFETWLPVRPAIVAGAGDVQTDMALVAALFNWYPALRTGSIAYVETTGNNGTAQVGRSDLPYQTINGALQSSARIIVLGDGVYTTPPDYRFAQAAAGAMKLVLARNRGRAIIRQAGTALSTLVWSLHSGTVWKATLTSAVGNALWTGAAPHRVRFTDTLDEYGFPARMAYAAPATNDATGVNNAIAAIEGGTGWTYDGALGQKVIYVSLGGASVEANKARLEALYYNALGNDRVYILGANLCFDGVYFDGTLVWAQEYNNGGTYVPGSAWLSNCWHVNSPGYGLQGDSNSSIFADQCRIHASALDGINTDSNRNGSGAVAKAMLAGSFISATGDVDTYGTAQTHNRQAISSHSGYFAGFGLLLEKAWGQIVADTSGAGVNSSWYVGCVARKGDARLGTGREGFGFYGATRVARLDSCAGLENGTSPLHFNGGASGKVFNCTFDAAIVADGGSVAPVAYTPDAP